MIGELGLDKSGSLIIVIPANQLAETFPEPIEHDTVGIGKLLPDAPFRLAKRLLRRTLSLCPVTDLLAYPDGFGFLSEPLEIPEDLEDIIPSAIPIRLRKILPKKVRSLFEHIGESVVPSKSTGIRLMGKQVKRYRYLRINDRAVSFMETEIDGIPVYILLGDSDEPVCYIGEGTKGGKPVQFLIVRFQNLDACKDFFKNYLDVTVNYAKRYNLNDFIENLKAVISG